MLDCRSVHASGSPATAGWKVQPEMASLLFSIALDHAAKNDADPVFEWLGTAKASHKSISVKRKSLAPFKADSRFVAILPKPTDFETLPAYEHAAPEIRASIQHHWMPERCLGFVKILN
jgi:hypothetical protein